MFDYIIIGAGFAGAVMAERIASRSDSKVLVVEKRNHIGGNCYDYKDENNILIHKYGPHLFHTDNKDVWDYLSRFTEWEVYQHEVLAFIDGRKVPIPFNLNTLYEVFPRSVAERIEGKLLGVYKFNSKVPILELKKAEDEDLQFLADYIYEKIFVNYTAKQWGMKPDEIDGAVTARVPVFIGRDNRYFNDRYQGFPKQGYTKLFKNIINHPNIKLMLNTDFKDVLEIRDNDFYFLGQKFNGKLIYTGMIDELFDYRFGELPYRSVDMKFETIDKEFYQEAATVNYPDNYEFTRITEFKHIHPVLTSKTVILKEYPQDYVRSDNIPFYPVFTDNNDKIYDQYSEYSKQFSNLMLLGRLAEYKYYDMDDIVIRILNIFDMKVNNEQ